ncbi:MAG TPA: phosphoglucosamine mutase [Bacilli bacterium]|nr:phosphoglucosamine mutase [Bacilli bacterium]
MTLAEKITHLRIANNMSQEQLAKVLGVARQSISKWEKGEAYPTVDKVLELTKLFRVTADELINDSLVVNAHKKEEKAPIQNKYFGTDGFRGESNKDLTAFHAFQVGRFLGWYYSSAQFAARHPNGEKAKVCIGKDTRRSSYMLEYALCSGITASGADAYILHVTTTPSVSYITRTEGFDCGVMITASHNVYYDNGIKILNSKGEKLDDSVSHLIESYIDGNLEELGFKGEKDLPYAIRENIGSVVDHVAGRNRYIGYLIGCSASSFRDMKIALDCANGASWMIARSVFAALGAEVYTIGCSPTGLNINKDCGSTHIELLQKYVVENHMDVGFAFDGDVDRCMAVDENGNVVDGDKILYILAKRISRHNYLHNNTVVSTIMSNSGLTKALRDIGISNVQTKVGDRFVYECMMQNNYWLGGEQSGHVILRKYATTGDGILTAIKITEEMVSKKSSLSKLAEPVHLYPQVLKNVRVVDKRVVVENQSIKDRVQEINKELNGNGRILLRESGTEPVIRIMVESDNVELCNKYIDSVYSLVKKGGYLCE